MKEINAIVISGRSVAEAKVLKTNDEGKVTIASVDLAVNKYSPKAEDHKKVEYYHVLAFGSTAERLTKVEKGTALMVQGALSSRDTKNNGITYRNTTIIAEEFSYAHFPSNTVDIMVSGRVSKELYVSPAKTLVGFDMASDFYDFGAKDFKTQFFSVVAYGEDMVNKITRTLKKGYRLYIKGHMISVVKKDEARNTTFTNQAIVIESFRVLDMGKDTKKKEVAPASAEATAEEDVPVFGGAPAEVPPMDNEFDESVVPF